MAICGICKRELDQPDDPLSGECGGDCWGCISDVEAELLGVPVLDYRKQPGKDLPHIDE